MLCLWLIRYSTRSRKQVLPKWMFPLPTIPHSCSTRPQALGLTLNEQESSPPCTCDWGPCPPVCAVCERTRGAAGGWRRTGPGPVWRRGLRSARLPPPCCQRPAGGTPTYPPRTPGCSDVRRQHTTLLPQWCLMHTVRTVTLYSGTAHISDNSNKYVGKEIKRYRERLFLLLLTYYIYGR